jgi:hypothetical protein
MVAVCIVTTRDATVGIANREGVRLAGLRGVETRVQRVDARLVVRVHHIDAVDGQHLGAAIEIRRRLCGRRVRLRVGDENLARAARR